MDRATEGTGHLLRNATSVAAQIHYYVGDRRVFTQSRVALATFGKHQPEPLIQLLRFHC